MTSTDTSPGPFGWIRDTWTHQWKGILAVWLLGTIAAGVLAYQNLKPLYRAVSLLRVDPTSTDLYGVKLGGETLEAFLATQVQLITSPNVLAAAATNPKAAALERIQQAGDGVQELNKAIQVGVIPGTYLIEVSMTSPDARESATLVNVVVDAFLEANGEWSNGMTRLQIKNLDVYSIDLRNQSDELERRWKNLVSKGDVDPALLNDRKKDDSNAPRAQDGGGNRASITVDEFKQVRRDMKTIELELAEAQSWLESARESAAKLGKDAGPTEENAFIEGQVTRKFQRDPEVMALAAQMAEAGAKADKVKMTKFEEGDPAEKVAADKVKGLKAKYQKLWETKSLAFREELERRGDGQAKGYDPNREVREAETAVAKLKVRQAVLKEQFASIKLRDITQATDAVEVQLIVDERASLKEMQEAVTRRLEQLKFGAKGEARIRPLSPNGAMVPGKPIVDRRSTVLGVIPAAMLFVSFALFVGIEADSRRSTPAGSKADPTGDA